MTKKRIQWIDIAKALGIFAVVTGHSLATHGTFYHFLYWWHMPIFFIASGFFLKPIANYDWKAFFTKSIKPLLISYFVFGLFLIMLGHFTNYHSLKYTLKYFIKLIYGGTTLNQYLSVFWYINVFIISLIVVSFIITYVKNRSYQVAIGFISLIIGTSYKHMHMPFLPASWDMPWDIDVAFIAIFFMLFGYLFFNQIKAIITNMWIITPMLLFTLFLIIKQHSKTFNFGFFMKSHLLHASNLSVTLFVTVIPIIVCLVILSGSFYIEHFMPLIAKGLVVVGQQTLSIMYLHKAILDITFKLGMNSLILRIIVAIAIPCLLSLIYKYAKKYRFQASKNIKAVDES